MADVPFSGFFPLVGPRIALFAMVYLSLSSPWNGFPLVLLVPSAASSGLDLSKFFPLVGRLFRLRQDFNMISLWLSRFPS